MAEENDSNTKPHTFSLSNGAVCGGCEIVRPLGAGAYGEVYLAVDANGEECAIKRMMLKDRNDKKTRQRFLQEAAVLKFATHPNVVRCLDYGSEKSGHLWMKLEYLRGGTIRDLLHTRGRFPLEQVLRLGRQACLGLLALHRGRGVHRDIKPENLFLIEADILKVLDFGLVKLSGSSLQTTGRVALGTALYLAPDYLNNEKGAEREVDIRWDVYSLGITLYEMLVGHPFTILRGAPPAQWTAALMHLQGDIPNLAQLGVPGWAAEPIMKAVARHPDDRYPTMAEFEKALNKAQSRALREHMTGTVVPRTVSAKVRLGQATTEPDVVRTMTQGALVSGDGEVEEGWPTYEVQEGRSTAGRKASEDGAAGVGRVAARGRPTVGRPTSAPRSEVSVVLGPQGTERMSLPPEWVVGRNSGLPGDDGGLPGDDGGGLWGETGGRALLREAGGGAEVMRTEPLDREALSASLGSELPTGFLRGVAPSAKRSAAPTEARDVRRRAASLAERSVAPSKAAQPTRPQRASTPSTLPADPLERDAAELAVWLKQGYLPPDVAKRLGLSIPSSRSFKTRQRGPAWGAHLSQRWKTLWVRWEALAQKFAVGVFSFLVLSLGVLLVWRYVLLRPVAAPGPVTVPVLPESPSSPSGGTDPTMPSSASASVDPAGSATPGSASASGPAPNPGVLAKPTSSRANDIYVGPLNDDEPPQAKGAAKGSATPSKGGTNPPKPSGGTPPRQPPASKKPAAGPTVTPSQKPAAPSILPFGKEG